MSDSPRTTRFKRHFWAKIESETNCRVADYIKNIFHYERLDNPAILMQALQEGKNKLKKNQELESKQLEFM